MTERKRLHLNWPGEAAKPARELASLPLVEACGGDGLIVLALLKPDGSGSEIRLGAAEAIAVAGDLIEAARSRLGRSDWPPSLPTAGS